LWRFNPDTAWQEYDGQAIQVKKSIAIEFRSFDKCNNPTEIREEYYEIDLTKRTNVCPDDMELVAIGGTRFCADRYEWPNRKGVVPVSYVSFYQAGDSCFTVGKRLCSSEEWSLACSGPYGWKYPYGQQYESNACVVSDTMPHASGEHSECRSWFGTFDMAGNLAEWTSTPAKENRSFYDVAGGFWESGASSGCFDVKYSYFPQNRHNPVGFRCCKDAGAGK
jgi:formylglycine-generating enzyme required for sulfatase activity